jgi:hypothetical protein
MADELSDKIVRLLEEIRDLTKERNEKLEAMLQTSRQGHEDAKKRYEDALQQQKDARERAVGRRRQFLSILTPLLLVAIGFLAYLAFWVIPKSEQKDSGRWMQQIRMIESNQLAQPH